MRKRQQASRGLWLILGGGILAYLGFFVTLPIIHCHYYGKEVVAVITDITTRMEGAADPYDSPRQVRYYTLAFDGHVIQQRTAGEREIGERLPMIYLDGDPENAVQGSRADGLWRTIERSTNERNLAIAMGVAIFFLLCACKTTTPKMAKQKCDTMQR